MRLLLIFTATPSGVSPRGGYDYTGTIIGFFAFAALIVLSFIAMRWMSGRTIGSARHMRVVERLMVAQGVTLMVVEVGQKLMAISVTKEGLRFLCELSPEDFPDYRRDESGAPTAPDAAGSTFGQRFKHNMRLQLKMLPKGTPPARPPKPEPAAADDITPSSFAVALLRAQAGDDKAELEKLLNAEERKLNDNHNPTPGPIFEAEGSGQIGIPVSPDSIAKNGHASPDAVLPEPVGTNDEMPLKIVEHQSPQNASAERRSNVADYNSAIESMRKLGGTDERINAVAPKAVASRYSQPPITERQFDETRYTPPPWTAPQPEAVTLREVPEPAEVRPVEKPAEKPVEKPVEKPAEKPAGADKLDDLFDKISQRSNRYSKKE